MLPLRESPLILVTHPSPAATNPHPLPFPYLSPTFPLPYVHSTLVRVCPRPNHNEAPGIDSIFGGRHFPSDTHFQLRLALSPRWPNGWRLLIQCSHPWLARGSN